MFLVSKGSEKIYSNVKLPVCSINLVINKNSNKIIYIFLKFKLEKE